MQGNKSKDRRRSGDPGDPWIVTQGEKLVSRSQKNQRYYLAGLPGVQPCGQLIFRAARGKLVFSFIIFAVIG